MIDFFLLRLRGLLGEDLEPHEFAWLFAGWRHPTLYATRRSAMIITRVRLVAILFAILTPSWMIVDYFVLSWELFWQLATGRLLATAAFVWLALLPTDKPNMDRAHKALIAMFAIPTLFFLYSYSTVSGHDLTGFAAAVAAGYGFLPFAMLAGIAIFPFTVLQCVAFALPMLLAQALAAIIQWEGLEWPSFAGAFWLLLVITAVATLASVSQLALMMALVRQAIRDPLTGVFSRRSGEELLALQDAATSRDARHFAIAFLDLDHFKQINDKFGHEAGDAVLRSAAAGVASALRAGDAVVRWGGEEFLLLLPDTTHEQAISVIERLRSTHGFGLRPDGKPVTASIGLAERRHDDIADWQTLVATADQRMYRAKHEGRDRIIATDAAATNATDARTGC